MPLALLVVTLAQILDLGTFVRMIDLRGSDAEANPVVAHLLAQMGLPFVAVAKIAALSVIVAVIVVLAGRDDRPRHGLLVAAIVGAAVIAGLIGGLSNAAAIL
jgi:hypothetical protein